ncbi:ATPase H(+)-transporting accessory protein 2 isoform X3 [Linepithema humile]|uniref:ATPase H(+)-transporting accessory protein 2 isoform X3 n=1 Tax=Linepithema humile TaxID=83485 RepID=UPI000623AD04|nr:PREDICTED: renin receptor isoform X3 [Linepithema humile]
MCRQLLLLFATLAAVYANDEFVILHSPDSVEFTGNGPIEQSSLKEIMCAALGFTGKQKDTEHSIAVWDPFSMPKALVAIPIDGIEFMPFLKDKTTYPLIVDEVEETTWQAIRSRIEERSNDNTLIRINLSDGVDALGQSALGELKLANMGKLKALNSDVEEDRKFIEEIQLLHAIADKASAKKHECGTDIYWLVVSALKSVMDFHGNTSAAANESYTLLNDAMERVSNAFVNTYDGKVVIVAFTNDASKMRNTRSVLYERQRRDTAYKTNNVKSTGRDKGTPISSDINDNFLVKPEEFSNRAKIYTENYPVIFNIILWFGVVFFFSLLAICIAIADMDPGRDSIIYRMTSNRMKKDN